MTKPRSTYPAPSASLRKALLADGVGCGIFSIGALVVLVGPAELRAQLDVYPPLLVAAGSLALLGVALFPRMARRRRVSPTSIVLVIATNAGWAVACCAAVVLDWAQPSPGGAIVIVAQALATGLIAMLEWLGLQRTLAAART